jgi:putative NIF3 family GTP cyclohydrolase 1 type 2
LNDIACLPVKDRASVVVSKNIKLYRPLVAMGVTSQVTDCDHFIRETSKGVAFVRECPSL